MSLISLEMILFYFHWRIISQDLIDDQYYQVNFRFNFCKYTKHGVFIFNRYFMVGSLIYCSVKIVKLDV